MSAFYHLGAIANTQTKVRDFGVRRLVAAFQQRDLSRCPSEQSPGCLELRFLSATSRALGKRRRVAALQNLAWDEPLDDGEASADGKGLFGDAQPWGALSALIFAPVDALD